MIFILYRQFVEILNPYVLDKYYYYSNKDNYNQYFYPANIYLFKFNNRNIRKSCETCSKLTKTPERRHWCLSEILIVNFVHISYLFLVFLLLTLNK